jgi:hypothetical protein
MAVREVSGTQDAAKTARREDAKFVTYFVT